MHIFFYARTLPLLFRSCFRVPRDDFPGGGPRRCWSSRCSSPGCPSSIRACSTTSSHASAPPVASLPPVRPPPAISLHLTHLRALLLSCLPAASELPRCRFAETKHAPATPLADARARAGSGHHQQRRGGPEWHRLERPPAAADRWSAAAGRLFASGCPPPAGADGGSRRLHVRHAQRAAHRPQARRHRHRRPRRDPLIEVRRALWDPCGTPPLGRSTRARCRGRAR